MSVGICPTCGCPNHEVLHVGTVAVALNCTGRHIRNLLTTGALRGLRIGKRCWRVDHAGLHTFLRQCDNRADEGVIPATTPQETAA